MSDSPRLLPALTPENRAFWTGGRHGELMIAHCDACDHAIHPPQVVCPRCLGRSVTARPARGTGVVESFTINHQAWLPNLPVPYPLAVVSLDGEGGVRITAQVVGPDALDVGIGEAVSVTFQLVEDVWIPQFVRAGESSATAES